MEGVGTGGVAELESEDVVVDGLGVGDGGSAGENEENSDGGGEDGNKEASHFLFVLVFF